MSSKGKKPAKVSPWRHIGVGALLGLYFGYFFRPTQEPSIVTVLILSVFVTLIYTAWDAYRTRKAQQPFGQVLRRLPLNFAMIVIAFSILAARHWALDSGGRVAVIAMMIVIGAVAGAWYAYREGLFS